MRVGSVNEVARLVVNNHWLYIVDLGNSPESNSSFRSFSTIPDPLRSDH